MTETKGQKLETRKEKRQTDKLCEKLCDIKAREDISSMVCNTTAPEDDYWSSAEKSLLNFLLNRVTTDTTTPNNEKALGKVYSILKNNSFKQFTEKVDAWVDAHRCSEETISHWELFCVSSKKTQEAIYTGLTAKLGSYLLKGAL
jgi:hypothetical protein